jgi:hypothetical protein
MRWRGIFSGVLVLAALQAILSTDESATRAGGLLTTFGNGVRHFLSPFEPAIPDLRDQPPATPPPPTTPPPTGGSPRGGTRPVVPTTPGNGALA